MHVISVQACESCSICMYVLAAPSSVLGNSLDAKSEKCKAKRERGIMEDIRSGGGQPRAWDLLASVECGDNGKMEGGKMESGKKRKKEAGSLLCVFFG